MKIGLIYHQFISRGGLEKYLHSFANQLVNSGHEIHVITERLDTATSQVDARFHRIPGPATLPSALRMFRFDRAAAALAPRLRLDVTIGFGRTTAHDLHRAGGGCHRVYSRLLNPWKRCGFKNCVELHLEKKLYTSGRTKRFVVNAGQVGDQLVEEYGIERKRVTVIHTAVDTARLRPLADSETRKALREAISPQTDERDVFLFVSRSHRRKGLNALLEAFGEFRCHSDAAELWVAGAPLRERDRRAIANHRLRDCVREFPGQRDLLQLYQAADFFVHPTLYDACANTVLESMACGLPGLISTRDGAFEFVEDARNGFLLREPGDPAAIHTLMEKAHELDEARREALGAAARECMRPLTWKAHLERWMEAIGSL